MSKLYCFAVHQIGIYMIGDTRLTTEHTDGTFSYRDDFRKVHKLSNNILFGTAGSMQYADIMLQYAEDLIRSCDCQFPDELAQLMSIRYGSFSSRSQKDSVELLIAGYDYEHSPQIFLLQDKHHFAIKNELQLNLHTNNFAGFWRTAGLPYTDPGFQDDVNLILKKAPHQDIIKQLLQRAQKSIEYYASHFDSVNNLTIIESIPYHLPSKL